jgi:hypothetical protein
MTGIQVDSLSTGRQHAYRTSLRRFVAEKWGAHDEIDDDGSDSEESENESVAGHFRAALSNAASKLRLPLRHKDRTPDLDRSAHSDDEADDGKSIISALSKTASNITTTLLKGTTLIKTVTHRAHTAHTDQSTDDPNTRDLIGKEISSNSLTPHHHFRDDSSTSSLDSLYDPIDDVLPEDMPDNDSGVSSLQHSPQRKQRPRKYKTAGSVGQSGRSKLPTRSKPNDYDARGEISDHQTTENRIDHGAVTKALSPKAGRRTAQTGRSVRRTKSHNDGTKHRKHRDDHQEHRATRLKEVASPKDTHKEPSGKERQQGVHRSSSLQRKHKECKPNGHSPTTIQTSCTSSRWNGEEKQRGVPRAKSHDLAHMHKRAERRTNLVSPSPVL